MVCAATLTGCLVTASLVSVVDYRLSKNATVSILALNQGGEPAAATLTSQFQKACRHDFESPSAFEALTAR